MSTRKVSAARPAARRKTVVVRKKKAPAVRRSVTTKVAKGRKSASNAVGSALGSALGAMFGGPAGGGLGGALGSGAQSLFRSITGHGDYKVSSNTLLGGGAGMSTDSLPKFSAGGRGMRLQHREYIQDIFTAPVAGAFNIVKLPLQPALTLPWASSVCQNYQEYKILGMIFEFKSTSSDSLNSTNTALGTVVMATQYNVLQPDFISKQQMDQSEFSCSTKPSQSIIHPIECARGESMLSVLSTRNGPAPSSGADLRLYDFANFYIATVGGQAANVNIGELWVSYDIELLKPYLGSTADEADMYVIGTGAAVGTYFGTTPVKSASSDLGTTLTATTITLPPSFTGNIQITYNIYGSVAAACTAPTITPTAGAVALNLFNGYTQNVIGPGGASLTLLITTYSFACNGGGLLTFSGGGMPTGVTSGNLLINVVPSTLRASAT